MSAGRRAASARRRFCAKPFRHLEITEGGEAYLCCSGWLPQSIGNVRQAPATTLWNGPQARAVRRSILDDSFEFCTGCPFLDSVTGPVHYVDELADREERALVAAGAEVADRIVWLNLAYDRTCNLACASCRSELVVVAGDAYRDLRELHDRLFADALLERIEWLYLTGSGDPFASRLYRELLRSIDPARYPRLKVRLHTNGLLFTPEAWNDLGPVTARVRDVEVSIDAASPATYARNRGGPWETLLQRLAFIAYLRRRGPVRRLQLSFVVQANNWREMSPFVDLGEAFNADCVYFSALRNWGTFSPDEYARRAVHDARHPEHTAFIASLADPRFRGPRVSLGDLTPADG
jgi:hypothetical protein